jgi:hypothetical protein
LIRLGVQPTNPLTYTSYVPDRYSLCLQEYINQGGSTDVEGYQRFAYGNQQNNAGDLPRYYFFRLVFDQLQKEGIRGDVAELGVYRGNTAALMAEFARRLNVNVYLLDTFEGFSADDLVNLDAKQPMQFADTSLDAVGSLVGERNVKFIRGHFPDTETQIPSDALFSLVHLDCDLGEPFLAGLRFFYPRMIPGGFLVMHDYSNLYWKGAEQAIDTFFADKVEKVIPIPDKSGTAVIRKI